MKILFSKKITKQYWKLRDTDRKRMDAAIQLFRIHPFDPKLKNHVLKGDMLGLRSISAGFDLRIIFEVKDGYAVVVMLEVGTHEDVY